MAGGGGRETDASVPLWTDADSCAACTVKVKPGMPFKKLFEAAEVSTPSSRAAVRLNAPALSAETLPEGPRWD